MAVPHQQRNPTVNDNLKPDPSGTGRLYGQVSSTSTCTFFGFRFVTDKVSITWQIHGVTGTYLKSC